jgi:Fic family protein
MRKLVNWYNRNEKKLHPIELAAELHLRFVFIHPFIDGNGRVSRLLMNLALLRNGFTIAIIPAILRHEYIRSLEAAHTDKSIFFDFITDRVIATQSDLIRQLKIQDDTVNSANDTVNDTVKLSMTER